MEGANEVMFRRLSRLSSETRFVGRCGCYGAAFAGGLFIACMLLVPVHLQAVESDAQNALKTLSDRLFDIYLLPVRWLADLPGGEEAASLAFLGAPVAWALIGALLGWFWVKLRRR